MLVSLSLPIFRIVLPDLANSERSMAHGAGRVGMEYHHRMWMDNELLSKIDEYTLLPGVKNIIFEMRINFIIKKKRTTSGGGGGDDEIIDSEKLMIVRLKEEEDEPYALLYHIWYRLDDYWMTGDEMDRLTRDAVDFGRQVASAVANPQPSDLIVIPIVVELDVCTVQQDGETIEAARDRAIKAQNMLPLYLWSPTFSMKTKKKNTTSKPLRLIYFLKQLKRVRVVNVDEGLALMSFCSICSKKPMIGAQISTLPCGHAFHAHCIVGSLEHDNLCPTCSSPAYDPDYRV
ncbi:hypothetical protein ACP275_14G240400 [Erythranthe tilingii]